MSAISTTTKISTTLHKTETKNKTNKAESKSNVKLSTLPKSDAYCKWSPGDLRLHCANCSEKTNHRSCNKCGILYCNRECQRSHKEKHEKVCKSTDDWRKKLREDPTIPIALIGYTSLIYAVGEGLGGDSDTELDRAIEFWENEQCAISRRKEGIRIVLLQKQHEFCSYDSYTKIKPSTIKMQNTGCRIIGGLPLLLIDLMETSNGTNDAIISGKDLVRLSLLEKMAPAIPSPKSMNFLSTLTNRGRLYPTMSHDGSVEMVINCDLINKQRVVYVINIINPNSSRRKSPFAEPENFDSEAMKVWSELVSDFANQDSHTLCIVINQNDGFIAQSYMGQYSLSTWLDFEKDLTVETGFSIPNSEDYFKLRKIEPKPTYRGLLNSNRLRQLASELDNLRKENSNHVDHWAGITGIRCDPKVINKIYNISMYRVVL